MIARISDNAWLYLEQLPPEFDAIIYNHFSAVHPRRRFLDTEQYGWDGHIRRYDFQRGRLALSFLTDLRGLCLKHDVPLDIVDERKPIIRPRLDGLHTAILNGITLEEHQIRAISACLDNDIGIIDIPTGGGKTEIMAGVVKMYNRPTVIIAEQRIVIDQIKQRLELRDVVDVGDDGNKVGLFYGGSTPDGQIVVVGSIQSLSNPPLSYRLVNPTAYKKRKERAKIFQAIVAKAQLLLLDECDKAGGSDQYKALFKNYYKGRLRFGFSGTPFDTKKPIHNLMLREYLGSVIAKATRRELEAIGRIIRVTYVMVAVGNYSREADKVAFDVAEREQIVNNNDFHDLVNRIVSQFKGDDGVLILVDTSNVEELGMVLERKIAGSKFIYGKSSKSVRDKAIRAFEARQLRCLIGGKILKRGMDLKGGCECLIHLGGGKLWSNIDQAVGRAVRNNKRKSAVVFSFLFLNNEYLYKHGREQLRAVLGMGYETKVMMGDDIIDGKRFLKTFRRG